MLVRAALVLAIATAAPVAAQDVTSGCAAGSIAAVTVDNHPMFDADDGDLDGRVRWAYRAANALHIETRERVIRRELLFAPGDCFDPYLLDESERLLRSYDIFATVDIAGERRADGQWDVRVETRDEWSTRIDVRIRFDDGFKVQGARIFETNLLGLARSFGAFYYEREVRRDYGLSYFTRQVARSRWDFGIAAGVTRAGSFVREQIGYPFLGELGRWAGRQAFVRDDQFFDYVAYDTRDLDAPHILVPVREKFFDVAVLHRSGERGRMLMVGGALSIEDLAYPGIVEVAPAGSFEDRVTAHPSIGSSVMQQLNEIGAVRASVLLGHRNVNWLTRRGLDSMRGEQDVRLGTEIGLIAGRSIPALFDDDDWRFSLSTYVGFEAFGGFFVARARGDVRHDLAAPAGTSAWQDLETDGELLAYWRRARLPRHTLVLRAAAAGAWRTRTPYQLTLGGELALRGYDTERFPGGRRLTLTLEDRFFLGWPFPDLFDAGLTVFADAGRMWAGDVPFGRATDWKASAGFGLRASLPAGGRTTYRLDFAWPLETGAGPGDLRIRFSIGEVVGIEPREGDLQIARSRAAGAAGSLFDFRNR
jgi:hypothetical protein